MATQTFTVIPSGNWPNEVYNVKPDFNVININLSPIYGDNKFKYLNYPLTEVDPTVVSSTYVFQDSYFEPDDLAIKRYFLGEFSTFVWNYSALRATNSGNVFNYFYLDLPQENSQIPLRNSFLIYPNRLFLRPISAEKINDNDYRLVTSAVLVSAAVFYFNAETAEEDAYNSHYQYLNSNRSYLNIPSNNNLSLIYNLCSVELFGDKSLIYYTPPIGGQAYYNPLNLSLSIGKPRSTVKADRISFSYNIQYPPSLYNPIDKNEGPVTLAQDFNADSGVNTGFGSTYILKYDPRVSSTAIFQLAQSAIKDNFNLEDIQNNILRCSINLSSSNLQYFNYPVLTDNGIVPLVSGTPNSYLKIQYVSDVPYIINNPVHSTLNSFLLGNTNQNIQTLSALSVVSNQNNQRATWNLKHPPHYYSYKLSFSNNTLGFSKQSETHDLMFYLSAGITNITPLTANAQVILATEHNTLSLNLSSYANKDLIKFKPIDINQPLFNPDGINVLNVLLSSFELYYSPNNFDYYRYDLINQNWINAASASFIKIIYDKTYGEVDLCIRPSLSTSISTTIESLIPLRIKFAKGEQQQPIGKIYLNLLNEDQNFTDLTVAHLNTDQIFPYKDLNNSLISWNYTPSNISNVSINSLEDGTRIIPNSAIPFNTTTATVRVSGYGPDSLNIRISSQKYNQFDNYVTNPSLFDLFSQGTFKIGLSKPIESLKDSKVLTLTSVIDYQGKTYPIPQNAPLYWTWEYNEETNPLILPITAFNVKNQQKYFFGKKLFSQDISAIELNVGNYIDPEVLANPNVPVTNELNVYLYSNISNPPVGGVYSIILTDRPSRDVFNTDFKVAYYTFPVGTFAGQPSIRKLRNSIIADTRKNQFVLTRPSDFHNDFIFYANTDIMPRLTAQSFVWSLCNNIGGINTLSSTRFSEISSFKSLILGSDVVTNFTLCAIQAQLPNWTEKFDTSTTLTFYSEPAEKFHQPLKFLIYPPYTWGLSGQFIKLLDEYNYTLAQGPTAYANRRTNSQEFYLSANKDEFIEYNIFYGQEKTYVNFLSTCSGIVNFPYRGEFYQNSGLKVSVIAYSEKYPSYNGLTFQSVGKGLNLRPTYELETLSFNITAETLPNSLSVPYSSRFEYSPKLKPYDPILLSFTPNVTSVDLDENRIISIDQTFLTQNNLPLSAQPTQNVQQMFSSNFIIYTLSSQNWQVKQFVPALKGAYDLFILAVGDPLKPLNISKYDFNNLKLTASGTMPMQILPSTFDLYPTQPLTANCVAFWNFEELSGTRIDSTGNGYNLELTTFSNNMIENVSKNFNLWSKTNVDVDPDIEFAPDGTRTADKVYINTTTSVVKYIQQVTPTLSNTKAYNFSIYAKPLERARFVVQFTSTGGAFSASQTVTYNLSAGTFTSTGSLISNIKMEPYNDGWYKCSVKANPSGNGTSQIRLHIERTTAHIGPLNYGLFYWNASLEEDIPLDTYPLSAIGIIGKSLSAAVTGVYLQTSGFDFGSDWTLSYWQKIDLPENQIPSLDNFISKSIDPTTAFPLSGITITSSPYIVYNNQPKFERSLIYSGPFFKPNQWNHIVFSASKKLLSVYLNGVLLTDDIFIADALYDYFSISNGYPFRISGLNKPIYLDAMGFWNRSLKSADVYNLYNSGSATQYPFENVIENYSGDRDLWNLINQQISAGPSTLVAYSTTVMPEVYLSTYFALTGQEIYIQFETPQNIPPDAPVSVQNIYISAYKINFGENSNANAPQQETEVYAISAFSDVNDTVRYAYSTPGIYNLSYDVVYNTGEIKRLELESPITIYSEWPKFDQQKIRLLNETILEFGNSAENTYTLDQIEIQPNEFGDVDIFNTAISRLYDNFQYLRFNSQTINTNSPTLFYGWLGCEETNTKRGIQWNTKDYGTFEWDKPYLATSSPSAKSFFTNIKSFSETKDHLLVIDGNRFRAFSAGKIPEERFFENILDISPLITNPISIDSYTDETGAYAYVVDSVKNKIYKFNLDFGFIPQINVQLSIGNFGSKEDNNKFNSPTEVEYQNNNVYILDYNNRCIKQYTSDLNWIHTYYSDEFESDRPESICIHPDENINFVYVITKNKIVYIFEQFAENYFEKLTLLEAQDSLPIRKINFDETGEFFYTTTEKNIYKYSATGLFISRVDIPNSEELNFNHIKSSNFKSVLISTNNSILRIQDIVQYFRIGDGLEQNFWTIDQITLDRDEFAEDINYNRSLVRMTQNIKSYRDIINSKFVIATEQLPSGSVSYFTLVPIDGNLDRPVFSDFIENENIGVGVNELHIPQVLNRELKKIYDALVILKDYLTVSDIRVQAGVNKGCFSPFCWSWRAMSCYNLSLPVIRICNVNPITYIELEENFPIKYAPTTLWGSACALCCKEFRETANPLV